MKQKPVISPVSVDVITAHSKGMEYHRVSTLHILNQ